MKHISDIYFNEILPSIIEDKSIPCRQIKDSITGLMEGYEGESEEADHISRKVMDMIDHSRRPDEDIKELKNHVIDFKVKRMGLRIHTKE